MAVVAEVLVMAQVVVLAELADQVVEELDQDQAHRLQDPEQQTLEAVVELVKILEEIQVLADQV